MFRKLFIFAIILSALTLAKAQEETEPPRRSRLFCGGQRSVGFGVDGSFAKRKTVQ